MAFGPTGTTFTRKVKASPVAGTTCVRAFSSSSSSSPSPSSLYAWEGDRSFYPTSSSSSPSSSSIFHDYSMNPNSEVAREILNLLNLSKEQEEQLETLASLVVEWNEKINLISRRECTRDIVYGRHIIPSLAPCLLDVFKLNNDEKRPIDDDDDDNDIDIDINDVPTKKRIVDVGTGGGFPGLPLAIANPTMEFVLIDSVGKKLIAVQDMANKLGLTNVQTYHGRVEVYNNNHGGSSSSSSSSSRRQRQQQQQDDDDENKFDICVGRSVAAIPSFCFWTQHLLKARTGHLVYMIGGDIDGGLLDQAIVDIDIEEILNSSGVSDKRLLVFSTDSVKDIASASGLKPRIIKSSPQRGIVGKGKRKAKGEWTKRDNSIPKQRGYEDFQRYDNLHDDE